MKISCEVKEARSQRTSFCRPHSYELARTGKSTQTESKLEIAQDVGGTGPGERWINTQCFFRDDKNVLKLVVMMVAKAINTLTTTEFYTLKISKLYGM